MEADPNKLAKLVARQSVYGDVVQNSEGKDELERLLKEFNNDVSMVAS